MYHVNLNSPKNSLIYISDIQKITNLSQVLIKDNFPHYQFILCTNGEGIVCSESTIETRLYKNTLVLISANVLFSIRPVSSDFCIDLLAFNGTFIPSYVQYFDFELVHFFEQIPTVLSHHFKCTYESFHRNREAFDSYVYLYELIGLCGKITVEQKERHKSFEEYMAFEGYRFIKQNIDIPGLTMNEFIHANHIDASLMDDIFLKYFNKAADELISFYRMEFAKIVIFKKYRESYKLCGFLNHDEMCSEFHQYTGMLPNEYLSMVRPFRNK